MDEIITAVSSVGFPIAMCTYVIVVINNTLKELQRSIDILTEIVKNDKGDV